MGPIHAIQTSHVQPIAQTRGRSGERARAAPGQGPAVVLDLSTEAQAQMALGVDEAKLPVQPVPQVERSEETLEELEEELQRAKAKEAKSEEAEAQEASEEKALDGLSSKEKAQVKAMAARDAEVRTHEQAHKAVGGALTGSITYTTEKGPDGRDYAIGGHVPIDLSPGNTPAETVQKAARIQAAALAPAAPSPADKSVAAKAAQMGSEARLAAQEQARVQAKAAETKATEAQDSVQTGPAAAARSSSPPGLAKAAASYARWAA